MKIWENGEIQKKSLCPSKDFLGFCKPYAYCTLSRANKNATIILTQKFIIEREKEPAFQKDIVDVLLQQGYIALLHLPRKQNTFHSFKPLLHTQNNRNERK